MPGFDGFAVSLALEQRLKGIWKWPEKSQATALLNDYLCFSW